jgi:hypothetical protein
LLASPRVSHRQLLDWLHPPPPDELVRLRNYAAYRHLVAVIDLVRDIPSDWVKRIERDDALRFQLGRARVAMGTTKRAILEAVDEAIKAGAIAIGDGPANAAIEIMSDLGLGDPKTIRERLRAHPPAKYSARRSPQRPSAAGAGTGLERSKRAASTRKVGAVHGSSEVAQDRGGRGNRARAT